MREYQRSGAQIYRESFATIRREADLSRFAPNEARVVVRMIHACGMIDLARDVQLSADFFKCGNAAILAGQPILCDSEMLAHGITRARLPEHGDVICTLRDERTAPLATRNETTRSAAALELWGDRLAGAVVAIGNAPTALFHLLEILDAGGPKPAVIIGVPVGFIGAAESKAALVAYGQVPFLVVHGRRGGSAMAAAAVNALAHASEQ